MQALDTAKIRHWLFEEALPYWAQHGVDHRFGGPVEEVALDGGLSDPGHKRVRVFCRQVYVFAHGYMLGWQPGLELAKDMFAAMVRHTWQGADLGWAKTVRSDNSILDPTTDLYDNAFALFSLGWLYKVHPDPKVQELMIATATLVDTKMRHPKLGFWHQLPVHGPRIQNPHMHLLEACLACYEATREPIFERLAKEVIGLFTTHFYASETQTLCEYFDDELNPEAGDRGQIVEPGHQFEWAWILASAGKLFDLDLSAYAKGLVTFAERQGVDPESHATYNSIYKDGRLLDGGSRTWPNTERLKAGVALYELFGTDTEDMLQTSLNLLFDRYFQNCPEGGWIDAFDHAGNATAKAMPTSTFYHLFLAFAEVLRVAESVQLSKQA